MIRLRTALHHLAVVTSILAALACMPDTGNAQERYLGYVWDLRGTWAAADDTLRRGHRIMAADSVRLVGSAEELPVLIVMTESGDRLRLVCDRPAACAAPIAVADSAGATVISEVQDRAGRIIRAVAALLSREGRSGELAGAYVRGAGFRENVVSRAGQSLDLTPLFKGQPAGRYRLELMPLQQGVDSARTEPYETTVSWSRGGALRIETPFSADGLYRVEVSKLAGLFSPKTELLVLVTEIEEYEEARRLFDEAVAVTRTWNDAPPQEVREFLQLYLQHMAEGTGAG